MSKKMARFMPVAPQPLVLADYNWHGFDHAAVAKRFTGGLEYVGTFTLDQGEPEAVYRAQTPDHAKGHKRYVLLGACQVFDQDGLYTRHYVRGRETLGKYRRQAGAFCGACGYLLYSVIRHDMRYCPCTNSFVDGGRDYLRSGGLALPVTIDLVEGKAVPDARKTRKTRKRG